MDTKIALKFLEDHSPMPDDCDLSQDIIDEYKAVRDYFYDTPNPICILPLLKSYGRWDCYGLYPTVEEIFLKFSADEMIPKLLEVIESPYESVRYWSIQICMNFPSKKLVQKLRNNLKHKHSDIRMVSAQALEFCEDPTAIDDIIAAKEKTDDETELEMFDEIISNLKEIKAEQSPCR